MFSLYDLVARPDLVQELREEVNSVLKANGGVMTTHALFEMKLLDSVMKESQRFNPGSIGSSEKGTISHNLKLADTSQVRFTRFVNKDITLTDGTHLPAGSWVEANHGAIVADPALYSNPEVSKPICLCKEGDPPIQPVTA